jgi:hypothetical protein
MASFEAIVVDRLRRFKRGVNLLSYEGTVSDRICYEMALRAWPRSDFDVICSVRPCMLPELVAEVRAFARANDFVLAGYDGDCSARYPWLAAEPRSCENVSAMIRQRLQFANGLLVSSGIINSVNEGAFQEVNRERSDLYVFESVELARHRDEANGRDWRTLFVLHGFELSDLIAAYLTFVSREIGLRHLPLCYLDCYHEQAQRRMIDLLPQIVPQMLNAVGTPAGYEHAEQGPAS